MQAYLQGSVVMTLFGLLDPQGVNLLQGFNRDLIMIDTWPAISSAGQLKAASSALLGCPDLPLQCSFPPFCSLWGGSLTHLSEAGLQ